MSNKQKQFMVENAKIIFRNFSGKEGPMNREGDKNFCVILDDETAQQMLEDGWNVRYLEPREEGDVLTPYIQVSVNFKNKPPRVVVITSTSRTHLDDDTIGSLDWAEFENVDIVARGYDWVVNNKSGTKAYLKTMFVTVEEDELERKYAINK